MKISCLISAIWVMVVFFGFSAMSYVEACACQNEQELPQKCYLDLEQIEFANMKIYVHVNGAICETSAIFVDAAGYYIQLKAGSGHCEWYEWECKNCKTCNLRGVDWECKKCGRGISE
jgi:hypothetical protein